ncbi:ATP-binding protein [bacterium]|nr:ATP-binding protein [candidate division CSSED10-310 bacterium]
MVKTRFLARKIDRLLELFPAVAIIGVRQCGKSTLVREIRPDWNYYDLERSDHYQLITTDPLGFFSRNTNRTIIDEAQQYPELFRVLRGVIDQDRKTAGRFILTGSSSPEIVRGLSETLAGRIATVELWPFKAAEYFDLPLSPVYDRIIRESEAEHLLDLESRMTVNQVYDQWFLGGYPEPRIRDRDQSGFYPLWMDAYFSDYIRRDIQRLFPGIHTHGYRLFIQSLVQRSGTMINCSEIARALGVSSVTVREYLEIIHGTFVWRNLRSFEKNPFKKVQKMPRGFFRDSGLLHHHLKVRTLDDLLVHPAAGYSFESFVTEEIIRGFQCLMETGIDFHFYRTKDKSEIDLIVDMPSGAIPIEIKQGFTIDHRSLTALKIFIRDTDARFGILVNNSDRIELLDDRILKLPARFL